MLRRLCSKKGGTLAEVLAAALIAALALSMLLYALSVFSVREKYESIEPSQGLITAVITLGVYSYEADIEVDYGEDGYKYG